MTGVISGISVVLIWSGWIVVSKMGVLSELTVWDITGIRYLTAGLLVTPFLITNRHIAKELFSTKVIICSLCCGILYLLTSLIGLQHSNAANVGVIVNGTLPVMCAVLLYAWKNTTLSRSKYIGITLILISNYLIVTSATGVSITTLMWFLLSCFFLAFYSVSMKAWDIKLKTIMFSVPIINCIVYTPVWYFLPSKLLSASTNEIMIQAMYQGVLVSIIALFLMSYAINRLGAVAASTIMALVPMVTALLAQALLDEIISSKGWLAIFICTLGVVLYNTSEVIFKEKC